MASTITAHDAAAEIAALINARPTSPRPEEIEAIIAKVSASPPAPDSEATARRRALQAAIDAMEAVIDGDPDRIDELDRPLTALTEEVWSRPPRTIADLQNRALIAKHWFSVSPTDDCGRGSPWSHPSDVDDHGEQAIAELIHAVLVFGDSGIPQAAVSYDREAVARWDRAVRAYVDGCDGRDDATGSQLVEQLCVATREVWAQPVRSWADVILLAAMTVHWNTPGRIADPPYPECVIAEGPECGMDEYAVATLVRAVLAVGGLSGAFDQDGRLLSRPAGADPRPEGSEDAMALPRIEQAEAAPSPASQSRAESQC